MPRIPYNYPHPGTSEVADGLRQRRKNGELIELDGMLFVQCGFLSFFEVLKKAFMH